MRVVGRGRSGERLLRDDELIIHAAPLCPPPPACPAPRQRVGVGVLAAIFDLQFSVLGYGLAMINNVATAVQQVTIA